MSALKDRIEALLDRRSWIVASMARLEERGRDEEAERMWPAYCRAERVLYRLLAAAPESRSDDEAAA